MAAAIRVLVADDEWSVIREDFERLGAAHGIHFEGLSGDDAFSLRKVLEKLTPPAGRFDVLLLDIIHAGQERPGQDEAGIRLFNELGESAVWQEKFAGSVQIVFFSNEASAQRAYRVARAKRIDVSGFLAKGELHEGSPRALAVLRGAAREAHLYASYPELAAPEVRELRHQSELIYSPNSFGMHEVWRKIVLSGKCHEPVFISGETGTGKELVAKAIQGVCSVISSRSKVELRGSGDFIPLNIAAVPSEGNLQYIELFGCEAGAFTDASDRPGLFERASEKGKPHGRAGPSLGATVFLDEIGDAHTTVQIALLRVLQENTVTRVGGAGGKYDNRAVVFRLITASHSLLENLRNGSFREDLYMRLNGIHIDLPPLRERKADIDVLVYAFLERLNSEYGALGWKEKTIDDASIRRLTTYNWPGNVRELEMAIRSSYVLSPGNALEFSPELLRTLDGDVSGAEEDPIRILEDLRKRPEHYTDLKKRIGLPTAIAVVQEAIGLHGDSWDDVLARQYFGDRANVESLRKWLERALKPAKPLKKMEQR